MKFKNTLMNPLTKTKNMPNIQKKERHESEVQRRCIEKECHSFYIEKYISG